MNLSYTPINEAYNLPKIKRHSKVNDYSTPIVQKKFLQEKNFSVSDNSPFPSENNLNSNQPYTTETQYVRPQYFMPESSPVVPEFKLTLRDPSLLHELKKYREDYIESLIKDSIFKPQSSQQEIVSHNENQVEHFVGSMDNDTKNLILIFILVLVIDIILRLK